MRVAKSRSTASPITFEKHHSYRCFDCLSMSLNHWISDRWTQVISCTWSAYHAYIHTISRSTQTLSSKKNAIVRNIFHIISIIPDYHESKWGVYLDKVCRRILPREPFCDLLVHPHWCCNVYAVKYEWVKHEHYSQELENWPLMGTSLAVFSTG